MSAAEKHAAAVAKRFKNETGNHEMTVLHSDGLYRHLRFRAPDTNFYWFDLITWPGHLTVTGDMGCYTFARLQDMFAFFRTDRDRINPQYWEEKIRGETKTEEYSEAVFRELVIERAEDCSDEVPGLVEAVQAQIFKEWDTSYEDEARTALREFRLGEFRFEDAWEWSFRDFTTHFLWCCHAIQWGISVYDASLPAVSGQPGNQTEARDG